MADKVAGIGVKRRQQKVFLVGLIVAAVPILCQCLMLAAAPEAFPAANRSFTEARFWPIQVVLVCVAVAGRVGNGNRRNRLNPTWPDAILAPIQRMVAVFQNWAIFLLIGPMSIATIVWMARAAVHTQAKLAAHNEHDGLIDALVWLNRQLTGKPARPR